MWFKFSGAGLIVLAVSVAMPAFAQGGQVQSKLSATQIIEVDGKTVAYSAAQAHPGDVVEYQAAYSNSGATGVGHLVATIPVPTGTTYVADSAKPASDVQASMDGVHFAPMPLMHMVKGTDGKPVQKSVPLSDYRALQWQIATLAAHAEVAASLRVRINPPVNTK
jgi:uncharacterized repeat protein (TIGR01451 family)